MQSVIEDAQAKCQVASKLAFITRSRGGRARIKFHISGVYEAIEENNIPLLIARVKQLEKTYKELKK